MNSRWHLRQRGRDAQRALTWCSDGTSSEEMRVGKYRRADEPGLEVVNGAQHDVGGSICAVAAPLDLPSGRTRSRTMVKPTPSNQPAVRTAPEATPSGQLVVYEPILLWLSRAFTELRTGTKDDVRVRDGWKLFVALLSERLLLQPPGDAKADERRSYDLLGHSKSGRVPAPRAGAA